MKIKGRKTNWRLCAILALLGCSCLFVRPAYAQDGRGNKVDYLSIDTGSGGDEFKKSYPGFVVKQTGNFFELEKKAGLEFGGFPFKKPKDGRFFERYIRLMTVNVLAPAEQGKCDAPAEAVMLATGAGEKTGETLYAYSYLVCADSPTVSPSRMMDKYVEKYGNADAKDWDRNQYIYSRVKPHYRVLVKPTSASTKVGALLITVVDDDVFVKAYADARARVRSAESSASGKF